MAVKNATVEATPKKKRRKSGFKPSGGFATMDQLRRERKAREDRFAAEQVARQRFDTYLDGIFQRLDQGERINFTKDDEGPYHPITLMEAVIERAHAETTFDGTPKHYLILGTPSVIVGQYKAIRIWNRTLVNQEADRIAFLKANGVHKASQHLDFQLNYLNRGGVAKAA